MPTDRIATTLRQDEARELHDQGLSWSETAARCHPPYKSRQAAYEGALASSRRDPARGRHERVALHNERLEWLIAEAVKVYRRQHFVTAAGRAEVVCHPETGEPLDDDGPKLEALKIIRGLDESQRKLWGDDAPSRKQVEFITSDMVDAEIRRLEAEVAANDPRRALNPGPVGIGGG